MTGTFHSGGSAPRTEKNTGERGGALARPAGGSGKPRLPFGRGGAAGSREVHHLGLVAALVLLAVVGLVTEPGNFATSGNVVGILALAATIGVITVGQTFVIIGGGIDLSVGSVMALASVWATTVATQSYGPAVMALCAVLVGTGAGVLTGLLISYGRLVPFIATLAMLVAARGLAQRMSDRRTQLVRPENDAIEALSTTKVLGLPLVVYIFAAVAAAGWLVLNRTTFGRRTFAVGGNPEAARLAGIDVRRHTLTLYALSGFCCGVAALIIMARTTTGSSTHGDLYELDAIAAVIIGGTLLTGGRGTIAGSILGVLVFTLITNLFILNGLQTSDQLIAKGAIIVIAVLLQRRGLRSPT
ncbi:ribose transport system permease protein [Actinomadura coerulea]|uniref:Ribose transport system permease protein n=1 Tax=Actinomadura coerulea TaxID=46159 RepID=A0A7X0G971_9ACTN|nr:ribose transport system permease protein [Actinomadura coerulea]GGQ08667.1 sugar ABC transporter permease [Actinomadura coerulea]